MDSNIGCRTNPHKLRWIITFGIFIFPKWIHKPNHYGSDSQIWIWDLQIQIFKNSFCTIVLSFVRICWICENRSNLWTFAGFVITNQIHEPISFQNSKDLGLRTFLDSRFVIAIRYKSMDSWDKCMGTWLPHTNSATLIPIHFDGSQSLICFVGFK